MRSYQAITGLDSGSFTDDWGLLLDPCGLAASSKSLYAYDEMEQMCLLVPNLADPDRMIEKQV